MRYAKKKRQNSNNNAMHSIWTQMYTFVCMSLPFALFFFRVRTILFFATFQYESTIRVELANHNHTIQKEKRILFLSLWNICVYTLLYFFSRCLLLIFFYFSLCIYNYLIIISKWVQWTMGLREHCV